MRPPTPMAAGLVLIGLAVLLVPLQFLDPPHPPHALSTLDTVRLLLGVPVVLWLPGLLWAPTLLQRDVYDGEGLDLVWWTLGGAALTLVAHVVNFNALRLVGLPIEWPALLTLGILEGTAGLFLLRQKQPGLTLATPSRAFVGGALAVAVLLAGFAVWKLPHFARDGSWYFYNEAITQGWDAVDDRGAISLVWDDGREFVNGESFPRTKRVMQLTIRNSAPTNQDVPVLLGMHGKVGSALQLSVGDQVLGREMVAAGVVGPWGPDPVERYWLWGVATAFGVVQVPAEGERVVDLTILPPEGETQPDPNDTWVVGWAKVSGGEVLDALSEGGFHHMHAFQLLNVTENIRWADEVAGNFVLAGRSPDGTSTLHQPPAWTYLYAPARQLLATHGGAASILLMAILLGIPLIGLRAAEEATGYASPAIGVALGMGAVQHGRLMVTDGSMNFPDSLYALALLAAATTLVLGRARLFVLCAVWAALLRYPGAVVVAISGFCLLALDASRRKRVLAALVRFSLAISVFCGVMLLVGIVSGKLETWFFALYFETIPEHFGHDGALPVLQRPVEFVRIWMLVGGAVFLAGAPMWGRLSKVLLGTALLYAPFLAFIDHFSHHYFLPLIALVGASTAAAIGAGPAGQRKLREGLFVALAIGLFIAAQRMNI